MIYWLCAISVFVKGVDNGERISVYTTNGFEVGNALLLTDLPLST